MGAIRWVPEETARLIAAYRRDQDRRGLSRLTIDSRSSALRLFAVWLDRDLLSASRDDVETFLDGRHLGPRARYRWVSDIHNLFEFAIREGFATSDPTIRIRRPKLPALLPRPIADEALSLALSVADRRTATMLLCAHLAGMRAMEIAQLSREDVLDTRRPPLLVLHGKGNKDRLVPLHPELGAALLALPMQRTGRVFRAPRGGPLNSNQVSAEVNTFLHENGISDTCHSLRHWFGTKVYEQTRDLRAVQSLLGHANPATTAGYVRWSMDHAVDGVNGLRRSDLA